MSFNPSTDVVLEVLNAADPARVRLAAQRLEALAAGAPAGQFSVNLDQASASSASSGVPGLADARSALTAETQAPDAASRVKVDFDAMLINSFVGEMLPKDAGSVFGEGTAGEMWRSMLSEQISRQIARSGALGLSRWLFATHEVPSRSASGHGEAAAVQASANILSAPSAAEIEKGAVLFPAGKGGRA